MMEDPRAASRFEETTASADDFTRSLQVEVDDVYEPPDRLAQLRAYDSFLEHVRQYEASTAAYNAADGADEDGSEYSFTFSEADLIPAAHPTDEADFHDFILPPQDVDLPSATVYSGSSDFEPKISIQRTVVIPDSQPRQPRRTPQNDPPATPQARTKSLTKSLPFGRSKKKTLPKQKDVDKRKSQVGGDDVAPDSGYGSAETKRPSTYSPTVEEDSAVVSGHQSTERPATPARSLKQQRRRSFRGIFKAQDVEAVPPVPSPPKSPLTPLSVDSDNTTSAPVSQQASAQATRDPELLTVPSTAKAAAPAPESVPAPVPAAIWAPTPIPAPAAKKDELTGVFRTLDSDFSKFQSKQHVQKAGFVKSNLLTFLHTYADHPATRNLRPEDLLKRATILGKWWTGLLEVLNGKLTQAVTGLDRAILLDGLSGIMERPEWRLAPSPFASLAQQQSSVNADRDPAYEGVSTMFIQKLFAQMTFVVERMSYRHAPPAMVSFSGKACAYAFFFCPDIADILVRLWDLQSAELRNLLDAAGVGRTVRLRDSAKGISEAFPPSVRDLSFASMRDMLRKLRTNPILPLGVENLPWYGQWVSRWCGSDSDLFYAFVKHYHLILTDFLPVTTTKLERLSAPGFVLVQAQVLANLNSTIHRAANLDDEFEPAVTFDDMLGPDSLAASTSSAPPANASRLMAENRLIMLLRDLLPEQDGPHPHSHRIFAEHFCDVVKASALSTSLFDHNACFTLCDFLQEAFAILFRVKNGTSLDLMLRDWPFWLQVFRKMVTSQNTMTEIRLYAFLFSSWNVIASKESRKLALCTDFLLHKNHFPNAFNHWCPMVRAYFMRLICWRIARFDGDATETDILILKTLMERLRTTWSNFNFVVEKALKEDDKAGVSTAPCNPAPGRRLLIIRTDTNINVPHSLLNLEAESPARKDKKAVAADDEAGPDARSLVEKLATAMDGADSKRKSRGFFGMFGASKNTSPPAKTPSPSKSQPSSGRSSRSGSKEGSRNTSPDRRAGSRASMYEHRPTKEDLEPKGGDATPKRPFQLASFKFSLEFVDRRPQNLPVDMFLQHPRIPLAAQLLLQAQPGFNNSNEPVKPEGAADQFRTYTGRALAEWTLVVNECQNFFERRRNEGVPSNKLVETPILGVESFRRPG